MYITPNSDLWLLKGVPLEPTYDHTIYWNKEGTPQQIQTEKERQVNFFKTNYPYIHIAKNSYIRADKNSILVDVPSEKMYSYNYMMFCNNWQNDYLNPPDYINPTGKWFFCFITKIEYKNNKTSKVYFEVDDIQTWHFDYELEQCYVERNHTLTDYIGDNLVPENLPTGEEYICLESIDYDMNDMTLLALCVPKGSDTGLSSKIFSNVYNGLMVYGTPAVHYENGIPMYFGSDCEALIETASTLLQEGNRIVHLYQVPTRICKQSQDTGSNVKNNYDNTSFQNIDWSTMHSNGLYCDVYTDSFNCGSIPGGVDSYTPKNNKMYTFPYSFMEVVNYCGDQRILKYEYFDINSSINPLNFKISGVMAPVPEVRCEPQNYRKLLIDSSNSISYSDFPMCSWSTDSFKAWLAQNWGNVLLGSASTVVSARNSLDRFSVMPDAGENPIGAAAAAYNLKAASRYTKIGAAVAVAETMWNIAKATQLPRAAHGNATQTMNAGEQYIKFTCRKMSIKQQFAIIVDNYFSRFGYAIMDNKIPVLNARPHWTYVKTIDCTIKGSIPAEALQNIVSIYNAGITWWNNASEIGNYNLDNSPTGTPGVVGTGRVGSAVVGQAIT